MWKGSSKLGQVNKPSSNQLQSDTKPCHSRNTIFLVYRRDPNLPLHQLLEPMQQLLGDPESGLLNLKAHHLALAIAKKTPDENCFRTAFKIGDRVHFKNKQPGKWDLKWRSGYWIVCIECNGHYLHIKNQATGKTNSFNIKDVLLEPPVEIWNIDMQFWQNRKIHQPSCVYANYYTHRLNMTKLYSCT